MSATRAVRTVATAVMCDVYRTRCGRVTNAGSVHVSNGRGSATSTCGAPAPSAGGEQDLAHVLAGLELTVRLGGIGEGMARVDDRSHTTVGDQRPDVLAHRRHDGRLLGRRPRPQRGGDDGAALGEQRRDVELTPRAALHADDDQSTAGG